MMDSKARQVILSRVKKIGIETLAEQVGVIGHLASMDIPDLCRRIDEFEASDAGVMRLAIEKAIVFLDEARSCEAYVVLRQVVETEK